MKTFHQFREAKEDNEPASPDEGSMALKQLEFIEYAAEKMSDYIKSGKAFPEWFQNKLAKAHGEIEGLYSYMGKSDDKEVEEGVIKTADRKPEKYIKPDGKIGIRMVPVDKQIVKNEAAKSKKLKDD